MPLATAILLTFALAPLVGWLVKRLVPRAVAVMSVVLAAFAAIILFLVVVAFQLGSLAQNLPRYQANIETKVESIKDARFGEEMFGRISQMMERLGREVKQNDRPENSSGQAVGQDKPPPLPVEVVEPALKPLQLLRTILGPLIEPLATGGIIIVVVIFMLMKREDLRDRFIRLVGTGDLNRTTEALQDAGARVGRYLLMQLVVNVTYAIPLGAALWIIGVPYAVLWGMLALILRFVPYIGPIIASIFPLALALAVDPGWTVVLWTAAIFIVLELVSNNLLEPWLYGSRTGLSSIAIIVAAIFWTWLWGPLGLLLSTPLTVCLVVLGRHVTQFQFLDVLLGNEPVLEPHQQLYQRLLSGDPDEATSRAEEYLEDNHLVAFYENIAIPALQLGELDRVSGAMGNIRRKRVAESALAVVDNLEEYAREEAAESLDPEKAEPAGANGGSITIENAGAPSKQVTAPIEFPKGAGKVVICAGGRGDLDDAAAAMLAQVLAAQGAAARLATHDALVGDRLARMDLADAQTVVIGFLNAASETHAKYIVRRLKRSKPLRVGIVFWADPVTGKENTRLLAAIGCDFIARSMTQAVSGALLDGDPVQLKIPRHSITKSM
ncbi:MAG TPA: AI-2E family transporter [Rhizobiaceae bacterium]|nr:AI-2E family transporter [Rhizobiaceae bacterium]